MMLILFTVSLAVNRVMLSFLFLRLSCSSHAGQLPSLFILPSLSPFVLCSLLPSSVLFSPSSLPSCIPSSDAESQVTHPSWFLSHDVVLKFWSSHFCLPYAGIAGVLQHAEVAVSLLPPSPFPNFLC